MTEVEQLQNIICIEESKPLSECPITAVEFITDGLVKPTWQHVLNIRPIQSKYESEWREKGTTISTEFKQLMRDEDRFENIDYGALVKDLIYIDELDSESQWFNQKVENIFLQSLGGPDEFLYMLRLYRYSDRKEKINQNLSKRVRDIYDSNVFPEKAD